MFSLKPFCTLSKFIRVLERDLDSIEAINGPSDFSDELYRLHTEILTSIIPSLPQPVTQVGADIETINILVNDLNGQWKSLRDTPEPRAVYFEMMRDFVYTLITTEIWGHNPVLDFAYKMQILVRKYRELSVAEESLLRNNTTV